MIWLFDIGIWDFFVFWCLRVLVAGLLLSMEKFLHSTFVIHLIGQPPQRFENKGDAHSKHTGQPHAAGKAGQKHRCILPPHGTISFHEKEPSQQCPHDFQNQPVGCALAQTAHHAVDQHDGQAEQG